MIIIKKPFTWIFGSLFIHSIFLFCIMSYQNTPTILHVVKPLEAINIEFFKSDNLAKKSVVKHDNHFVKKTYPIKATTPLVKTTQKTHLIKKAPKKTIAVMQKPVPQKNIIPQKIIAVSKPAIQKNTPAVDSVVTGSINPTTNPPRSVAVQNTPKNDFLSNAAVKTLQAERGNKGATAVFQPKAKYTLAMLRKRMKGVVSVKLFFDVHGKVSDYKIIKSTRYKLLNQAVVNACRQYRIKPPQKAGKAIAYADLCIQEMTYN